MKAIDLTRSSITKSLLIGLALAIAIPVWSQEEKESTSQQPVPAMAGFNLNASTPDSKNSQVTDDRMMTPPPVSGQTYPVVLTSEERSNLLRLALSFTGAYSDNAFGNGPNGRPVKDESYSVAPTIAVDKITPRMRMELTYAPGFTFYQHTSSQDEPDENASIEFEYRLSPHVTFTARDGFQKSSNVFNHPPDLNPGGINGGSQSGNFSVIAPIAARLSNSGNVGASYQFGQNDMIGGSGTFTNLNYPDPSEVPGLYDSSSQSALTFYSHRMGKKHYLGFSYGYQRLVSYPPAGLNETQTHAALVFYSVSPTPKFSISLFSGPQYSKTVQPTPLVNLRTWTPAVGVSLSRQGPMNTFVLSYSHLVAGSGGLIGAVQLDSATASLRQQVTRTLSWSLSGGYAQNDVIGSSLLGVDSGHSIFADTSVQQQLGQHFGLQIGYSRIHQSYSNVEIISSTPNTNRVYVSVSYQFLHPLGR